MDDIKVYTIREAAAILKVTERTMYTYIKSGDLKASKIGNRWRVSEEDIRLFLTSGKKG